MKSMKDHKSYDTTPEKEGETILTSRNPNVGRLSEKYSDKFNVSSNCTVVLNSIDSAQNKKDNLNITTQSRDGDDSNHDVEQMNDSDNDIFEFEESDTPLIPLYHLRDEGSIKWVLLSDLCNLLKVKSKETLLKQV